MKNLLCCLSLSLLSVVTQAADKKDETVQLQSTFVGDKEQPSVSYIMPWKPPEGPEKLYRPIDAISGDVLDPLDRDQLLRGVHYYEQMALEQKQQNKK